jgi:hypothetical protein
MSRLLLLYLLTGRYSSKRELSVMLGDLGDLSDKTLPSGTEGGMRKPCACRYREVNAGWDDGT